jgi:hypothetical protein
MKTTLQNPVAAAPAPAAAAHHPLRLAAAAVARHTLHRHQAHQASLACNDLIHVVAPCLSLQPEGISQPKTVLC